MSDAAAVSAALWQKYRDWLYFHEGLGCYVDVSRMRFDDAFVSEMEPRFAQAFKDMDALEGGAIANPDENRMVGHYWLRAESLAPEASITEQIASTRERVLSFAQRVHSGEIHAPGRVSFTDVLCIGIGGSALGPQFVADALAPDSLPLAVHFIDNTDPAGIDRLLNRLRNRLDSTLVVITSKSGGTPEPRNGLVEVRARYEAQNLPFAGHAVAVTGVDSKLDNLARAEGWLATFPIADWVGGRTSVMSAVGLLPAALQGIDIVALLAGARDMDSATRTPTIKGNPAALLALSWYFAGNGRGERDMVVIPYKDSLLLFSRYLQQLIMESLGKRQNLDGDVVHQGLAVYGNKGSTDQHAYVQQLRDGISNFFVTFIEVLQDRVGPSPEVEPGVTAGDYLAGFLHGTRRALYESQRDSITVTMPAISPRTVGALIALYERAVGLYASLVRINAYHQPGVEAGKKAAAAVLELQRRVVDAVQTSGSLSLDDLAQAIGAPDEIETIYLIVRHLAANERGIALEGNPGQPASLLVKAWVAGAN